TSVLPDLKPGCVWSSAFGRPVRCSARNTSPTPTVGSDGGSWPSPRHTGSSLTQPPAGFAFEPSAYLTRTSYFVSPGSHPGSFSVQMTPSWLINSKSEHAGT